MRLYCSAVLLVCLQLVIVIKASRNILLPLIFDYGKCHSVITLKELLLHLETVPLDTQQHYNYHDHSNVPGTYLPNKGSFKPPDTVYIVSEYHTARTATPLSHCLRWNSSGVAVSLSAVPSLASVAIYQTPCFIQELSVYPYNPDSEPHEQEFEYLYYLLHGSRQPHEIEAFAVAVLYSHTTISIHGMTGDLVGMLNGKSPFHIRVDSESDPSFLLEQNDVLWVETPARDCFNVTESLKGIVVTSDKPLGVYTAKAQCQRPRQFNFDARVVHQIPVTERWGTRFIGDALAFTSLTSCSLTLFMLSTMEAAVNLVWYDQIRNESFPEDIILHAHTVLNVTNEISNITHFTINSYNKETLLVVYDVFCHDSISNQMELFSSVLLQPVEWYSSVQSVYQHLPDVDQEPYDYWPTVNVRNQRQYISLYLSKDDYNSSQIELVAKRNDPSLPIQQYSFYPLSNIDNYYTVFEIDDFYLLHFALTTGEFDSQKSFHSLRHHDPCARMGATVFSYANTTLSRASYSNGYLTDLPTICPNLNISNSSGHTWPVPTRAQSSILETVPSITAPLFTSPSTPSQTSNSSLPQPSSHPSLTTPLQLTQAIRRSPGSTHSSTLYKAAIKSSTVRHSLPTRSPRPLDSSDSSKANSLAAGMGAMAAGLCVLLAVILVLSLACWWRRKQWRRPDEHIHNNIRLDARYLPLEEPAEEGYEFDVFLSFAEEERDFVERVLLLPLRQKGYSVFWHHEHFVPGYDIGELIHNAIHSCRRVILVCTTNFTKSSFCLLELRYSLARQCTEGKRCIIPIVFENNIQCCPRELQGVNQIRLGDQNLTEEEIDDLVDRLALGEPLEPVDGGQQRESVRWINDVL